VTAQDPEADRRGAYVFAAAGCAACHTDMKGGGPPLAGGRPLKTPFGVFYSPNITSDPETGIGRWTEDDLRRALREGIAPGGTRYFPVFPYASFTGMSDGDIADLWAYLRTVPRVARANHAHEVTPPFGWRFLMRFWNLLYLREGPLQSLAGQSEEWNRGRYLVEAIAHCGECHTPRNWLGALDRDRHLAGNPEAPDGQLAPNITPDAATGLGKWSIGDIAQLLETGETPYFDTIGKGMREVVKNSTSKLTDADRRAIAVYLKSLPPRRGLPRKG
jgi:mono/diheme cytochrome c family protein